MALVVSDLREEVISARGLSLLLVVAATTVLFALAACGGSDTGRTAALYTASATRDCLADVGTVDAGSDHNMTGGGAYFVHVNGKRLQMSFGENVYEAKYLLIALLGGEYYADPAVYRIRNVVFEWYDTPGPARDIVEACLR